VAFGDGPFVERIGFDDGKKAIGLLAGTRQVLDQLVTNRGFTVNGWHEDLRIYEQAQTAV
jgi:hypothetical protein